MKITILILLPYSENDNGIHRCFLAVPARLKVFRPHGWTIRLVGQVRNVALIVQEETSERDRKQAVVANETIPASRKHWKIFHTNLL